MTRLATHEVLLQRVADVSRQTVQRHDNTFAEARRSTRIIDTTNAVITALVEMQIFRPITVRVFLFELICNRLVVDLLRIQRQRDRMPVVEADRCQHLRNLIEVNTLPVDITDEEQLGARVIDDVNGIVGLEILQESIETYKQNFTRFIFFDEALKPSQDAIDKASLCFTLPHKPGSLAQILTILSFYDMNLTRIQSLPIPGREWQYFFYADIKFGSYTRYVQALAAVRPLIEDLTVLGEYKSAL